MSRALATTGGDLLPDRPSDAPAAGGGTVGAAAERFARLTLAQAPQTQRTYRGCVGRFSLWLAEHHVSRYGLVATVAAQAPVEAITADAIAAYRARAPRAGGLDHQEGPRRDQHVGFARVQGAAEIVGTWHVVC